MFEPIGLPQIGCPPGGDRVYHSAASRLPLRADVICNLFSSSMKRFIQYLDEVESLKKQKKFDDAWKVANQGINDLLKQKDEMWFMMYYQMAEILALEKKWPQALFQMGLVIHFLHGLGGSSHEHFVKDLLKKFDKESRFNEYLELSIQTEPKALESKIQELINR